MDPLTTGLVLVAAVLHATWSAIVKSSGNPFLDLTLVSAAAGLIAVALLPFVPAPAVPSWPFLAATLLIHGTYNLGLVRAYRLGDLSHVYPIMRGAAPLLAAAGAFLLIGEKVSLGQWIGIGAISLGIMVLGLRPRALEQASSRGVGYALLTAVAIAGYTLTDGVGVRLSGSPLSYAMWLFALTGAPLLVLALLFRRADLSRHFRRRWRHAAVGGAASMVAYGLVLWAMALGAIAPVAALRETSVIFAALIGVFILREPLGRRRIAAAAIVAAGAVALKLA